MEMEIEAMEISQAEGREISFGGGAGKKQSHKYIISNQEFLNMPKERIKPVRNN